MKKNILLLLFLCCGLIVINSCKTDTKENTDQPTITKESTVSMRLRAEPDRLNPMLTTRGYALQVCKMMYPTLLDHDPFTLELVPVLVKTRPLIEEIKEGERNGWTKYTYELIDEAVWDNGAPLTAEDYIFTLKVLFNTNVAAAPYRGYLDLIKDATIDPDNPKRFTVYTSEKYVKAEYATGLFIYPRYKFDPENVLANYKLSDLRNPELADQYKNDEVLIAFAEEFNSPKFSREKDFVGGCGAYQLEEWVEGERVVLVKKENWWGDKLAAERPILTANPKRLIFKPISDATTALTLMKSFELDISTKIPEPQFNELKASDIGKENFIFETPPVFGFSYYGFNTKIPKLSDKRVRKAIAHLVDVDEILKSVKLGYGEAIVGPFHPMRDYYHTGLKPIKLDVGVAKKLLREAGWVDTNDNGTVDKEINGEQVEMELDILITPNNKPSSSMALIFQNEAKKAGVRINIVEKEAATLFAQLRSRDFEIYSLGSAADVGIDDPKQFWHSSNDVPHGSNRFGFGNAESDKLIDDLRSELDETKRNKMFLQLQEILYEEQPAVFLYATKDRMAIHKRFKGVETSIKSPGYFANYWYE